MQGSGLPCFYLLLSDLAAASVVSEVWPGEEVGVVGYKSRTWRSFLNDTLYLKPQPFFSTPGQHIITLLEWGNRALSTISWKTVPASYATFANTQEPALAGCCYAVLILFLELLFCMWNWARQWSRGHTHALYVCCSCCHMSTDFWFSQVFVSSGKMCGVFHLWLSASLTALEVMPSIQTRTCSWSKKKAIVF